MQKITINGVEYDFDSLHENVRKQIAILQRWQGELEEINKEVLEYEGKLTDAKIEHMKISLAAAALNDEIIRTFNDKPSSDE